MTFLKKIPDKNLDTNARNAQGIQLKNSESAKSHSKRSIDSSTVAFEFTSHFRRNNYNKLKITT